MNHLLLSNCTILTFSPEKPLIEKSSILIQNGEISKIASINEFKDYSGESLDFSGKIVMPGLINAHHHFYSTLVKGLTKAEPAVNFNEVLKNLWWRLDIKLQEEDIYFSTLLSIIEAIKHGTTTIIDHHASPGNVKGSLKTISKAVEESGIRACLCYEVSDRDGEKVTSDGINENIDWLKRVSKEDNQFLKGLFGMHAAFTLSDKTLEKISEVSRDLDCGFHLHVAEAQSDEDYSIRHFNKRVVERLAYFGLLNDKSIAAHCVHINDKEMEILADKGVGVVHNPQSNLNNAVGIANVIKMVNKGLIVGLGTDAMTNNMLEEIRVALWAQHWRQENPSVGFGEIGSTLTINNPLIANRYWQKPLGIIKEGYAADIIALDYLPPTPLTEQNWLGHLIYGISQSAVDTTIINGKVLFWNKQLFLDIEEEETTRKSQEIAQKLWNRF
ncbi:MAG: putative aminohydrolase SsnA [Candidatus Cloacimonetes bacterium]|nr:putative aminohydrolase SsnA [Candidatus Cloacimonadota bacterium]